MQLLISGKETELVTSIFSGSSSHEQFPPSMKNSTLVHTEFTTSSDPLAHQTNSSGIPDHLLARSCNASRGQEKPIQDCELEILVQSGISIPTTALPSVLQSLLICHHALCINYFLWPAPSACCSLKTQSIELLLSLLMPVMLRFSATYQECSA